MISSGQLRPGALSAAEVRGSGGECQAATAQEQPRGATQVRGQWRRLGGATQRPRSGAAGRRHPALEVRGGGQVEPLHVQGQGRQGGENPRPRPGRLGGETPRVEVGGGSREELPRIRGQGRPGDTTSGLKPGAVALSSHPAPEARGGGWEEPPLPKARGSGREASNPRSSGCPGAGGPRGASHVEDQEGWW